MEMKKSGLLKTALAFASQTAFLFFMLGSLNATAAVVIDFQTGPASAGGTIIASGGHVTGSGINISLMVVDGTATADGDYEVTGGVLSFDTLADTIQIEGAVNDLTLPSTLLLSGSFDSFSYDVIVGNGVFSASGPDVKSPLLLDALGVARSTPFDFFGFSVQSVNGTVIATDIVNTAVVPLPAAAWLFGSALLGLGAVTRKRT